MKCLNLTKGFNPFDATEAECIQFESFTFSGGESHIKLGHNQATNQNNIIITHRLNSMNDLGLLLVAVDAVKRQYDDLNFERQVISLFIPYFPGARQDRVMVDGEALTVKVYTDIINSLNLDKVIIFDPHSDVAPALINNCEVINNHKFVSKILEEFDTDYIPHMITKNIICPDAGASKKIIQLTQYLEKDIIKYCKLHNNNKIFQMYPVTKCDKIRNTSTGELTGFEVYSDDLQGKDCIIVDDICDGGGTFMGLAEELKKKNAGDLYLIVSHGIFSKRFKELSKHFKAIYTTDSWRSKFDWEEVERDNTEICNIIPFKDFL